jgi:hypothetical protein
MAEKKLRIANSYITIGKKYVLDHKPDPSAPNGMRDMTKFPFEGNALSEKVFFDDRRRQFDTCFYVESPSLRAIVTDDVERAELVKQYTTLIKNKYEKTFNEDLEPSEKNQFWENYRIEASVNKQYDTNNINDLMELFHLLNMGAVCEKDEKNPILRKDASFIITSSEKLKTKSKDKVKIKTQSFILFNTMLNADRDKLDLLLQWLGKEDPSKIESEDLGIIYYGVINGDGGEEFCESFLRAEQEYSESEKGKEKMEWFYSIRRLLNKRKIKRSNRGYVATDSDIFLGNTLQDIAKFCLDDKSTQFSVVKEMIEENPDVRRTTPEHLKPAKV